MSQSDSHGPNKLDTARGPWKSSRATEGTMGTLKQSGQATDAVVQESAVEKRSALKHGEAGRWESHSRGELSFEVFIAIDIDPLNVLVYGL